MEKSKPDLSLLTLHKKPTSEGGMLYKQYYYQYGMTPDLKGLLMTNLGWNEEHIA